MTIIMEEREVKGHPVIEITLERENAQPIGPVLLVQINIGMMYFENIIYHDKVFYIFKRSFGRIRFFSYCIAFQTILLTATIATSLH